jgi:hypothetical protein
MTLVTNVQVMISGDEKLITKPLRYVFCKYVACSTSSLHGIIMGRRPEGVRDWVMNHKNRGKAGQHTRTLRWVSKVFQLGTVPIRVLEHPPAGLEIV